MFLWRGLPGNNTGLETGPIVLWRGLPGNNWSGDRDYSSVAWFTREQLVWRQGL